MDIRKKGFICVFIYNLIGTVAVCSLSSYNPTYEGWIFFFTFLTLPISFLSFAAQFTDSLPLYYILSIQFIMLLISSFLADIILRNYSPAYIEKKEAKYIARKQQEFNGAVTQEQVSIYLKYQKDINNFTQTATPLEKAILSTEQWYTIDNMTSDILLIKKGQISSSTKNSIEKKICEKLRDQATLDLLYTVE